MSGGKVNVNFSFVGSGQSTGREVTDGWEREDDGRAGGR